MPAITITLAQLDELGPCATRRAAMIAALDWSNPVDAAQAAAAGATLDDLVWVAFALSRHDPDVERRLRLWMTDCAAHVLHIFERERPTDTRPRTAILTARRFARGEIDTVLQTYAYAAACAAACAASQDAVGNASMKPMEAAAWSAAWAAYIPASAYDTARSAWAARSAIGTAEERRQLNRMVAWTAGKSWQLDRFVARMSADEPEDWPLPPTTRCAAS